MKKGDIIVNEHPGDYKYITKLSKLNGNTDVEGCSFIRVKENSFENGYNYSNGKGKDIRLATPEEILWYNECVNKNKFIPFSKINLDFTPQYEIY